MSRTSKRGFDMACTTCAIIERAPNPPEALCRRCVWIEERCRDCAHLTDGGDACIDCLNYSGHAPLATDPMDMREGSR